MTHDREDSKEQRKQAEANQRINQDQLPQVLDKRRSGPNRPAD